MRLGHALPWLAIPAIVVPFCLWFLPDWWAHLDSYGRFKWVIAAWAAGWVLFVVWWTLAPPLQRAYWAWRGVRLVRRLDASERAARRADGTATDR